MLARELASFWRENVVAVVTLLRVLARMSNWRKQDIWKFYHLAIGRGRKPPSLKITVLTFPVKNGKMKLSGESILRIREKNFKSNLILVVVLVLESKGLYCWNMGNKIWRLVRLLKEQMPVLFGFFYFISSILNENYAIWTRYMAEMFLPKQGRRQDFSKGGSQRLLTRLSCRPPPPY